MGGDGPGIGSPLLDVKEAAKHLNMSTAWIYSTLRSNIPHVKVGGALRFRKEDIDRYIASRTVAPMNTRDVKSPIDLREIMRKPGQKTAR